MISLSMNLLFGVPALAGPGRLKAGHHTDGTTQTGSWCQCTASKPWGLSMNLPLSLPSPPLLAGERVAEGRERGIRTGSGSKCTVASPRGLSMNRRFLLVVLLVLVLDWVGCLRGRGRARGGLGSWSQCTVASPRGLSLNRSSQIRMTNDEIRSNTKREGSRRSSIPVSSPPGRGRGGFVVLMQGIKAMETTHESLSVLPASCRQNKSLCRRDAGRTSKARLFPGSRFSVPGIQI